MKLTRRTLLLTASMAALTQSMKVDAGFGIFQIGNTPPILQKLKIGAGGLTTAFNINADGTLLLRTDVGGGYIYNRSAANPGNAGGTGVWQQLVTTSSMPAAAQAIVPDGNQVGSSFGVYELCSAPSNSSVIYMVWNGIVRLSLNGGTTFINDGLAQKTSCDAQSAARYYPNKMAVDPVNADCVILTTPSDGVFATTNGTSGGSASWSAVSGIAAPTGTTLVAYDVSGTSGSPAQTNIAYIGIYGTGIYKRSTPGGSYSLIASTPTHPIALRIAADGKLYTIDDVTNKLWQWDGASWTDKTPGGGAALISMQYLACDPSSAGHLIVRANGSAGGGGGSRETTNINVGSVTWTNSSRGTTVATDIPYLATLSTFYDLAGDIIFDTVVSGQVWMCGAQGLWASTAPLAATPTWTSTASGIEELVSCKVFTPPGSPPICCSFDVGELRQDTTNKYVISQASGIPQNINCVGGDYASNNSSFVAISQSSGGLASSSSGTYASWTPWANNPPLEGEVACASSTNWMCCARGGGRPQFTLNGATSAWTNSLTSVTTGWNDDGPFARPTMNALCADRVNIGTFYIQNFDATNRGTYISSDQGQTLTKLTHNLVPVTIGSQVTLAAVPGNAGHLFISGGYSSHDLTKVFYRSTNAGSGGAITWSDPSAGVYTVRNVWAFGIGAAKPGGGGYPAIYIYGAVDISGGGFVYGLWRSIDNCATWQQLSGMFPGGWLDQVTTIDGDMSNYGYVYLGFVGTGYEFGNFQ